MKRASVATYRPNMGGDVEFLNGWIGTEHISIAEQFGYRGMKYYALIHLPTGMRMFYTNTKDGAASLAQLLEPLAPTEGEWGKSYGGKILDPMRDVILKWREENPNE